MMKSLRICALLTGVMLLNGCVSAWIYHIGKEPVYARSREEAVRAYGPPVYAAQLPPDDPLGKETWFYRGTGWKSGETITHFEVYEYRGLMRDEVKSGAATFSVFTLGLAEVILLPFAVADRIMELRQVHPFFAGYLASDELVVFLGPYVAWHHHDNVYYRIVEESVARDRAAAAAGGASVAAGATLLASPPAGSDQWLQPPEPAPPPPFRGAAPVRSPPPPAVGGEYMVIDLAEGPSALRYPISYLSAIPAGGWTEEHKTTKLVLRRIPAGSFMRGSPTNELGRTLLEEQVIVTLTKDFYIGVFEVTQRQWERVMGNWPSHFRNPAYRESRPVERVSYYDIRENPDNTAISPNWPASGQVGPDSFMGRLRARTGLDFDLPTASQWEYACRAGTTSALNSGRNLSDFHSCSHLPELGRYKDNHAGDHLAGPETGTEAGTATVGSYLPNAWGLYDMHGNVWEWCLDWYEWRSSDLSALVDPAGPEDGLSRVHRGGSWVHEARKARSAHRGQLNDPFRPHDRFIFCGFRLALTL